MIESMTGYGQRNLSTPDANIDIEIKSLNNKYIDISLNINNNFRYLEIEIRNIVKSFLNRGSIYVNIYIYTNKMGLRPKLNRQLLQDSLNILNDIQRESATLDNIKIEHILSFKDVITYEEHRVIDSEFNMLILDLLKKTLDDVKKMRVNEGAKIEEALRSMIQEISSINSYIKERAEILPEQAYKKLKKRMENFEIQVDENRLLQELALFAERSDIREEVDRIDSHINQFNSIIKEYPCGKKLDFLTQEFLREFNTISSKVDDIEIKSKIILAKTNIDRIREQVQNIV
jgi:uncharacterized protein (TIGR00255 family)